MAVLTELGADAMTERFVSKCADGTYVLEVEPDEKPIRPIGDDATLRTPGPGIRALKADQVKLAKLKALLGLMEAEAVQALLDEFARRGSVPLPVREAREVVWMTPSFRHYLADRENATELGYFYLERIFADALSLFIAL